MAQDFTPVFIGGTGRSGTTILLNLLNRHPDFHASMPREIKYLTSRHGLVDIALTRPYGIEENLKAKRNNLIARALPLLGKSKVSLFEKELLGTWWSETGKKGNVRGLVQGITREELEKELEKFKVGYKVDRVSASRALFESLSRAQMKDGVKRYFGDSTPVNIMQADLINQLLPRSKFIHVIRDGRDVASSVLKEKWGPSEHFAALDWWKKRIVTGQVALSKIKTENKLELRIEDLVIHQREATFEKIKVFLDLPNNKRIDSYFEDEILPEKLHAGRWKSEPVNAEKFSARYQAILQDLSANGINIKEM
jgi:hypothetical protein